MKGRSPSEPVRKQRSVFYRSSDVNQRPFVFYLHMFPEDVSNGIMPIGGRTRHKGFAIKLSTSDPRTEEIIAEGLDRDHLESLQEAVCGFFQTVAAHLCFSDRAVFEIVYFEEPETQKVTGFELILLNPDQLIEKRGKIYQIVEREIAEEMNVPELIFLPTDDLVVFTPPKHFANNLRVVRANLAELDRLRLPETILEASKKHIPYDFKAHERSQKLALVEAVKPIGWNARGSFNDCVTSYYWIRLLLKFESFKIELRRSMLAALNEALLRIGRRIDFTAQIEISGLPLRVDVTDALRKLDSGEQAFTEIMKEFELR